MTTENGNETSETFALRLTWIDYTEFGILLPMGVLGAVGNALVMLGLRRQPDTLSTDVLVMTMSVFEFLDSTVCTTLGVLHAVVRFYIFSSWLCITLTGFIFWTAVASAFFIGCLAVDRYMLTCWPLSSVYDKRIAKMLCFLATLVSCIFAAPSLLLVEYSQTTGKCQFITDEQSYITIWNSVTVLTLLSIFVVTSFCYYKIAWTLRKRLKKRIHERKWRETDANVSNSAVGFSSMHNVREETTDRDSQTSTPAATITGTSELTTKETEEVSIYTVERSMTKGLENDRKTKSGSLKPSDMKNKYKQCITDGIKREESAMNRMTRVLFVIAAIYLLSWGTSSVLLIHVTGFNLHPALDRLMYLVRRVNIISNPLLFVCLSSKIKVSIQKILCGK